MGIVGRASERESERDTHTAQEIDQVSAAAVVYNMHDFFVHALFSSSEPIVYRVQVQMN
jgi:hypothetical protein